MLSTVVGQWQFRYLKLDFLYAGCLRSGDQVYDRALTRAEALQVCDYECVHIFIPA